MADKTKKKSRKQQIAKAPRKKTNVLPALTVVTVVVCIAVMFLVNRNGTSNESNDVSREVNGANTVISSESQVKSNVIDREVSGADILASDETQVESDVTDREINGAVTIAAGESMVIPTADITGEASFFPVEVDGTNMEVIAVRDSAGDIRTAFNTCQICYDSGRGYYVQSGDYLVCQNCGNRFSVDQVEIESGGCNPWPIFDENKTVNDDEISISYDFLVDAQGIFENWKDNY